MRPGRTGSRSASYGWLTLRPVPASVSGSGLCSRGGPAGSHHRRMPKTTQIPQQQTPRVGLPPAGDWLVQSSRSSISLSGRASRLAPTVRIEIGGVHGGLHLAVNPNESRVGVSLDVRTVTTRNPVWDEMLRVADPLHAAHNPMAHFASTTVEWTGYCFQVRGELTMGGISTSLALTAMVSQNADTTVTLRAEGEIDPRAAGIALDIPGAKLFVPRVLKLSIDVIAARTVEPSPFLPASHRFALAS